MYSSILPTYNRVKLSFHSGKGSYLITKKGRKYLDFTSGIAVTSLGHCNSYLIKVLTCRLYGAVWFIAIMFWY